MLLLLSGCIDSLSADQRLYCLDLTEKAYAFVPDCETESQCFALLEGQFFGFDETVFSSEIQNKIYAYKNNVALSWIYFNKARESIAEIHAICSSNQGISMLLFHLNELTHNMAKAFEFSDNANRESFAVLLLEYGGLQEQEIELVKEEPLFDDFALIANNLNQLSSESSCLESESYACFYLSQMQNFEALVSQTGFQEKVVSEANSFDLLSPGSEIIGGYVGASLGIPLIGPALPFFLSYLSNVFTSRDAIQGLEKAPSFQFIQSYSAFMGTENSCLSKFNAIMENDALHRQQLMERNQQLESEAGQGIEAVQKSIDSLLSETYTGFDQNFFQSIYSGLGQESGIAAQKYSIRDFGELREQAEAELLLLKQRLLFLRQQDTVKQLSLGKKASDLKRLNLDISALQENLKYLSSEVIEGLLVLCNERAVFIENKLDEANLPQDFLLEAADLKARAKFKLSLFNDSGEREQKLVHCKEMVQEFDNFSSALQDFEQYMLQEELSLSECFSFIESVLDNSQFDLDGFRLRFHELQKIEKPYVDLASVQRLCLSLHSDLEGFLKRQAVVQSIEGDFALAKKLFSSLELAKANGFLSDSKIESLESQIKQFSEFFSNESILLEKSLPVLSELESGLEDLVSLLGQEVSFLEEIELVKRTEFLELVSISSSEAILRKELQIECMQHFESLPVSAELLDSNNLAFGTVFVSQEQNALPFSQNGNIVSFFVENCKGKHLIQILFSVQNPIKVSISLLEEIALEDSNSSTYLISMKNTLPLGVKQAEITLLLALPEKEVLGIELLDSSGKTLKFSMLPGRKIAFSLPLLLPMQERKAFLTIVSNKSKPVLLEVLEGETGKSFEEIQPVLEKMQEFGSKIAEAEESLAALDKLFSSVSDEQLISAKYVTPISLAELDKIRLKLNSLKSFQGKKQLQDFSAFAEQKDFDSAFKKSEQFSDQLDSKLLEAEDLASRLDSAFDQIKEDAVVSFNSAAELFNQNPSSPEAEEKLEKAKEQLLEGNFLESIASSKNATGLVSLAQTQELDLPVFIWPIAVCSGLVLFVRFKKKKNARQRKELVKKIEKNW